MLLKNTYLKWNVRKQDGVQNAALIWDGKWVSGGLLRTW